MSDPNEQPGAGQPTPGLGQNDIGKIHEPATCPECGRKNLIIDAERGERVCGDCGFVLTDQLISDGPEWRAFNTEERQSRTRAVVPISRYDPRGGVTRVGYDRDYAGRKLKPETQTKMRRLRTFETRSRIVTSKDRNISSSMPDIDKAITLLHLPSVISERVKHLYLKCLDSGMNRGRSNAGMAGGAIYSVIRQAENDNINIKVTINQIAEAVGVEKKELTRNFRMLQKEHIVDVSPPQAINRYPRIFSKLEEVKRRPVPNEVKDAAVKIYNYAERQKKSVIGRRNVFSGKDPSGLAAAMIYIAGELMDPIAFKYTQGDLSMAAGITEVTIRNRYRGLLKDLGIDENSYVMIGRAMESLLKVAPNGEKVRESEIIKEYKRNYTSKDDQLGHPLMMLGDIGLVSVFDEGGIKYFSYDTSTAKRTVRTQKNALWGYFRS